MSLQGITNISFSLALDVFPSFNALVEARTGTDSLLFGA